MKTVPMITQHVAIVRNMFCERDSRSRITARSEEELFAKVEAGRRRGETADVVESWTETVPDPAAWAARERELARVRTTTCLLPPPGDLRLRAAAKRTSPMDWRTIDPDAGSWSETRLELRRIRSEKYNEMLAIQRGNA